MFKKISRDCIEDMLQACNDIEKAIEDISFQKFRNDMFRYRAAERLFEVLGEAANRIPKEIQEKYPEISWSNIIGMRNIIIHCYEKIDTSVLWGTAKKNIPEYNKAFN